MTDLQRDDEDRESLWSDAALDQFLEVAFEPDALAEERGVGPLPAAIGGHQVLGPIGHGGMGIVLRGRDPELGRDVALKVLKPRYASVPAIVERFIAEARIGAQLQHPSIVPIHRIGTDERGEPYFTMKLVEGRSLAALLADRAGPDDERPRVLDVFLKTSQAAAFAHAHGIVHRDLKPSNVMVGSFGEVHLVDWGLAKVLRAPEPKSDREPLDGADPELAYHALRLGTPIASSMAGEVLGTLAYMAPEQARGEGRSVDARADVFALGGILCEILTGSPPYAGASRAEARERAAKAELGPAHARLSAASVDVGLAALAMKCLVADPDERPRDAGELVRALEAWFAAVDTRARAAELAAVEARTRGEQAAARAAAERRARRTTTALATVALAVTLGGSALYSAIASERRERLTSVEAAIAEALQEASALRAEADAGGAAAPELWARADAAVVRAVTATETGGAAPERRAQVLARQRELRAERDLADAAAARDAADRLVVAALERAREDFAGHFKARRLQADTQAALAAYGIDIEASTVEEAAARIAASRVARGLLDALDYCGRQGLGAPEHLRGPFRRLLEIAQAADSDPARVELRRAILALDAAALRDIAEAADLSQLSPSALDDLGGALALAGEPAGSRALLRRAQALHPGDFWLCHALVANDASPESVEFGRACVAIRPESPAAWNALGVALGMNGRAAESCAAFERVLELDPDSVRGYMNLALAAGLAGDPATAVEAARQAVDRVPEDLGALNRLLSATLQLGDLALGLRTFEELTARFPSEPFLQSGLGRWRFLNGDFIGAVAAYEAAIALDPAGAAASWCDLAAPLRSLGRFRAAHEALELGQELGSSRQGWRGPSPEERAEHRALAEHEARIAAALAGDPDAALRVTWWVLEQMRPRGR